MKGILPRGLTAALHHRPQVLLHGDLYGKPRVLAQVRHAEAADAEDPHHTVGTKPEAGRQRLLVVLGAHRQGKVAQSVRSNAATRTPARGYARSRCRRSTPSKNTW